MFQLSKMVSFFSVPKAFKGHIDVIQQNAIRSWLQILPPENIFLMGDDEGVSDIAKAYQLQYMANLKSHETYPVPLLSDIFKRAVEACQTPYLCYINTDIILMDDFVRGVEAVLSQKQNVMMVSSRYNMDITQPITDMSREVLSQLRTEALTTGDMYPAGGTDFFLAPKSLFSNIPAFLLGRGYWDNWLMYWAKKSGAAVVDTTADIVAIHQNHDYSHIEGIVADRNSLEVVLKAEQGEYNFKIAGGKKTILTNYDANYILKNNVLYSFINIMYWYRPIKAILRRLL
ncbi:MAG: hypothetical protein KBF71_01380 [Alphaproteobacteria bacterium]|jgi:hypothetical protein|nr:hypothetical protein [Alphaproteobacteria bacterium]